MKRETIKSLTIEANEIESSDYMDVLVRDVINGNHSQLQDRLNSMNKKDLLQVINDVTWDLYTGDGYMGAELMEVHKRAYNALSDKLSR